MNLGKKKATELVQLLKKWYPDWKGFSDEEFIKDEINYKKPAIEQAKEQLSKKELQGLIDAKQFDEIIDLLDSVGKANNLLWRSVPRKGDLGILYEPNLNKPSFCNAVFDLLHGKGESPDRLGRYLEYVESNNLMNKWTFPTYFLFVCYPEHDMFIKPKAIMWFMNFIGANNIYTRKPSAEAYARILEVIQELKVALKEYEPHDILDIQSFIWMCYSIVKEEDEEEEESAHIEEISKEDTQEVDVDFRFTKETFKFLEGLYKNPTKAFYREHKEEFNKHLKHPFANLLNKVAKKLPEAITDEMETEKDIVSRIPKNDFGRGGAWDFYWGAFYPKGGYRVEDAQLFLLITKDEIRFGFGVGSYSSNQKERFKKNCTNNHQILSRLFAEVLSRDLKSYSVQEHEQSSRRTSSVKKALIEMDIREMNGSQEKWDELLLNPDKKATSIAIFMSADEVIQTDFDILATKIAEVFEQLFILVLLAIHDDPMPAINDYLEPKEEEEQNPEYPLTQVADDTGFEKAELERWVRAIHRKGQAIFYGPPGTGKTFIAEWLARHLIGGGDGFMDIVQFHPAYDYEDFMQGIRPKSKPDGGLDYPTVKGRFLNFCDVARKRKDNCVLILDEINRANLARVLGELMYLLEYRNKEIPLAGGGRFKIPKNVRLIGTMNTADRSIALVDHALRRRFAFLALYPKYELLERYHKNTGFKVEGLVNVLKRLNGKIDDKHYFVGITFFLKDNLVEQIADIWQMEIEPYLEEYFFDQPKTVDEYRWDKVKDNILM